MSVHDVFAIACSVASLIISAATVIRQRAAAAEMKAVEERIHQLWLRAAAHRERRTIAADEQGPEVSRG